MSLYTVKRPGARLISDGFAQFVRLYVRLKVYGLEHLPQAEAGAWLLAANHASHADTAVLYAAVPRALRRRLVVAAAQDYFFVGGLRQQVARTLFSAVPVDRQSGDRRDPLRHVIRALREGYAVLIFPEGTRSREGTLGPFRSGIGRLVAEFPGLPLVPAYIKGAGQVLPKGWGFPLPRAVSITFGAPLQITAAPNDRETWRAAANVVREAIGSLRAGVEGAPESEERAE